MARIICKSSESLDDDPKSNNDVVVLKHHELNKLQPTDTIDEELLVEIKINDRDVESKTQEVKSMESHGGGIKSNKTDGNCLENENGTDDDVVILRNKNNRTRLKKQNQLSKSIRLEKNRLKSTMTGGKHEAIKLTCVSSPILPIFHVPDDVIVVVKDGKFSWDTSEKNTNALEIDFLEIPKGIV